MNYKKFFLLVLFVSVSIHSIAQTDYYYYKGKKIPLYVNDNEVCVSIPKVSKKVSARVLSRAKILEKISDDTFDIFVVRRQEFEKIKSSDSWKEDAKVSLISSSYRTADDSEVFATPYLNVRLKNDEDIDLLVSYAEKFGLKIVMQNPLLPLWYILAITHDCGKTALECANELWETGLFSASEPDLSFKDMKCSNDPLFNQQWGLHNSNYAGVDISAPSAWDYATGKGVKIAILDTGVDMDHTDLAANISSLSYDTETFSSPSVVYGDHGTHCAGIAAAVKDNGIQIAGVAPDATIVPISNQLVVSANTPQKLAFGIIWAYQNGADIISNSWYYPTHHAILDEAIQLAVRYGRNGKGSVVVFASGNGYGNVSYPANCNDTILVVGAIDNTGTRAGFSNYGAELNVVAPGVDILSTLPNNQTGYKSGTSMACPHVAGVAALILERNPELTVTQVNSIINTNAKKLSGVNFNVTKADGSWNNEYGYGLVDAYSSVINTSSVICIQNETVTGAKIISADNIFVGRNVTNRKEFGDVVLGPGIITLKAKYTEIRNSTSVPLGTTLTIEN